MNSGKPLLVLLAVLLFPVPSVYSQTCGDVDNSGVVNISDLIRIIEHISYLPDPAFDVSSADCDGITGVTISDAERLSGYMFRGGTLDCNVSGSYGFLTANEDTIFIPRLLGITDGTDMVRLMVYAKFSSPVSGYYLPLTTPGSSGNSVFSYTRTWSASYALQGGGQPASDTIALYGLDHIGDDTLNGSINLVMLEYSRNTAGTADIAPEATDRGGDWQISILRYGDLYRPVIAYYDAALPAGIEISTSTHDLYFSTVVDSAVTDTAYVDFDMSAPLGVEIQLTRTESWIVLDDFAGVMPWPFYNTPVSVPISADASGLGIYDYTGTIYVYYKGFSGWLDPIDSINVTLSVTSESLPPIDFPPGDLNCDGEVDISDIVYLVIFLFLNGPAPVDCI